jgi:hypothetical protein
MSKEKPTVEPSEDRVLPATRWLLLKDTLHYRFWDLMAVSLLTLLFILPLIAWLLFATFNGLADPSKFYNVLLTYAIAIPLIMLFGLGMAGAFYFSKKLAWGVGAVLPSDFFEGIRKNAKMFLLVYFFIGLLYLLLKLDLEAVNLSTSLPDWGKGAIIGVSYGLFLIFLSLLFFVQTQTVTYEGSFFQLLGNANRFLFGAIFPDLGIFAAFYAPFLVFEFLPNLYGTLIPLGFSGIFYFGFSVFFLTLYSHSLFDKTINPKFYPDIIRKGLAKNHENPSVSK